MQTPRATTGGYTLIELLVVIALIAVLAAVVGIGLRGADAGRVLTATGGLVRAQLDSARSRAVLHGRAAAFAVRAEPSDADRHLREVWVVQQDETGAWTATEDGVPLLGAVRLLPPDEGSSLWSGPFPVQEDAAGAPISCYLVRFAPNGTLLETGGGELWWSADPENSVRRGVVVSRYGAITAIEAVPATEAAP